MTTVAVVAPWYTEVGGMQNYARRVVGWLRARDGYDVVVITSRRGLRTKEEFHDGVRIILLGTWLTLSATPVNPLWYFQLRRLFRRLRVDVVNAHSPVPYLADMAILAAGRRPTVLTYHSGSLVKGAGGIVDMALRAYERFVQPRIFARATRHIAVSPVASNLRTGRATLIAPGVDTEAFAPAADGARNRSIVYVGRIEKTSRWKGLDVLLDALPLVGGATLEFVGDGDLVPELHDRARRLGVADRIHWHGALAPAQVAEVLQRAGTVALPSLTESESFGMALIEAMAAGCPVVASDVGGIPHVVRDGVDGLLVPPGDAAALARALSTVLDDHALAARLGCEGRKAATAMWDWRHQEERTIAELRAAAPRRMRLAVVTDSVSPWHTGGKEQRQHELLTRLAARGFEVDVYTMRWWGKEKQVTREGITFHGICPLVPLYTKDRRSIRQAVMFALATLRMLTRRYDVLEVDAIPFLQLFPTRIVAWLRRKPMVVTWHEYWGSQYWAEYLGPLGRVAAFVERTAIRLPDRILAASDGTAQRLREVRRSQPDVHVVTPGIVAATLAAPAHEPWTPRRPLQLVYAGRLLDHKRVDVAIDTVSELAVRGVDARLTVIGAGPHADALQERAKRSPVADRIQFLAFLPEHADVLERMACADLFLFPSVREGFGMVALEAMAMGTPVITSDHPDNFARHLVRDGRNGMVCAADPTAFADAIETALERLGELSEGATTLAADFDWERITDRAEQAYLGSRSDCSAASL